MRYYDCRSLFLSCLLGVTAGSGLLPLSPALVMVQASELGSQKPQEGVIKTCTGQRIDLGAPQLTDVDLKTLTSCSSQVTPQLLEALKSQDWKVKVIAAHTLGLFGTKAQAAIPALSDLLQDRNVDVRFVATQALGEIGTEAVAPTLIKALQDKDENVRVSAADKLLQIGAKIGKKNLVILIKFFRNRNQTGRLRDFTLVDTLKAESSLVVSALVLALEDGNWFLRDRASKQLKKVALENSSNVYQLLDLTSRTYDGFARRMIVNALAEVDQSTLIQMLQTSKDSPIRIRIINILGLTGSEKNIPDVSQFLQDSDGSVTHASAYALRQIGTENAASTLISSFEDNRKEVRSSVAIALWSYDSNQLTEVFEKMLRSNNVNTRLEAIGLAACGFKAYPGLALAIQKVGAQKAVPILLLALEQSKAQRDHSGVYIRLGIVQLLGQLNPTAISMFIRTLSEDETFELFYEAASTDANDWRDAKTNQLTQNILNQLSPHIIPKIVRILQDKNPKAKDIRGQAINLLKGIARIGSKDAESALVEILHNGSESERLHVATNLIDIGYKERIPLLIDVFKDSKYDLSTRLKAAEYLIEQGFTKEVLSILPTLIEASEEDNEYVRTGIIKFLGDTSSKEAIPLLLSAIQDEYPEVRRNAIYSLAKLRAKKSVQIIIKLLQEDPDDSVRSSAAQALGSINSEEKEVIPALIESLKDNSWMVRLDASNALKSIGVEAVPSLLKVLRLDHEDFPLLQSILKDKDADHRRSVAFVLGEMGELVDGSTNELLRIIWNENDNLYVRWMSAVALEKTGHDMNQFFKEEKLVHLKNLTLVRCPDDSQYSIIKVNDRQLVYSGQCIYGFRGRGMGGSLLEIYGVLKTLLNRR